MTVAQPTDSGQPLMTAAVAKVALVKGSDRADGARRAIELLQLDRLNGKRVFLKPNFNSADPPPASTHLAVLRTLVQSLNEMGAGPITVGERSGMGETRSVLEQTGLFDLSDELGFDVVVFDELAEADWVIQRPAGSHWADGFAVPRMLLESDCVVQTCNVKTHQYGGHFTMSLKNSVGFAAKRVSSGGYNYMSELHSSPDQRRMIAEINTVYTPTLIVMDGVEAFVDGGPAVGTKVAPEVMLAGTDRIAMDAVGVAILRLFGTTAEVSRGKIFELEQIARAVELELGIDSPAKIQLVTGDSESESFASALRDLLD